MPILRQSSRPKVVLLAHDSIFSRIVLKQILLLDKVDIVGIVLSSAYLKRGTGKMSDLVSFVRKVGVGYSLYQLYISSILPLLRPSLPSFKRYTKMQKIVCLTTNDASQDCVVEVISALAPDFLLSFNFNQKIDTNLSSVPKGASINIHPSFLPYYKGVDPLFFAKKLNDKRMGVSIHFVADEFDCGDVLVQEQYDFDGERIQNYMFLFKRGADLAVHAITNFAELSQKRVRQSSVDKSYFGWKDIRRV